MLTYTFCKNNELTNTNFALIYIVIIARKLIYNLSNSIIVINNGVEICVIYVKTMGY